MATIGLDKLFYSKITEGENGDETYETPAQLAKAMTAELSWNWRRLHCMRMTERRRL